ncbi:MAG: carboxypeptidase-like regulatory domain-containing protein, partial [Bacteroides sp.]|nr:carboxypeptidase-like regulatory domain-containing protein [Bacteroides sp.]
MREKIHRMLFLVLLCTLWAFSLPVAAQTLNLKGTVTDASTHEGLIGANIKVKGTTQGCITDIDGNFSLSNVNAKAVLVVSSIGYATQEVPVNGQSQLNIVMKEDSELLAEVVVIGYGTMDKKELTSAISHVSEKDFLSISSIDPTMMIQGKVPGVSITNTGAGDPNNQASIQIRGVSSRSSRPGPQIGVVGLFNK